MKILVTGADGFIGSHLAEALVGGGNEVTALVHYNSFDSFGWLDECDGMEKIRGDVRDVEQMARLVKGHDVVFHLAALVSVPDSYERPRSYVDTNVIGTLNVLSAALSAGARVVHTSSSEVYGTALYTPQDEHHPLQAQSPYAASKSAADGLSNSYWLSYGLDAVTIRPFNTYGPRQSERAVIARIIRQVMDPRCEEVRLGALHPKRDWTYVLDTVASFLAVGRLGTAGEVYNASSGQNTSVGEIVNKIMDISGIHKPVLTTDPQRPESSEVGELLGDSRKLEALSSWRPAHSLEQGLARTIEWWQSRDFRRDLDMVA